MYLLKLYHASEPTKLITSRLLEGGELTIGRDSTAAWRIDDPQREISRIHCIITVGPNGVLVSDMSSNGASVGAQRTRLPPRTKTPLALGDAIYLGGFIITVEHAQGGAAALSPPAPAAARSPFAPPPGLDARPGLAAPRPIDPFASALAPDPLDARPRAPSDPSWSAPAGPIQGDDAWTQRRTPRVGDWDVAPSAAAKDHTGLIGSDPKWFTPPPAGPPDLGFGFDAPFHRPMLQETPVSAASLLIPSDWDAGEAAVSERAREIDRQAHITPLGQSPAPRAEPARAPDPFTEMRPLGGSPAAQAPPSQSPFSSAPVSAPFAQQPSAFQAPAQTPQPQVHPDVQAQVHAQVQAEVPPLAFQPRAPRAEPFRGPTAEASGDAQGLDAGDADHALFKAFCEGAKLDPADLAGQDAAEVLRRAGVLYQQMVLGLSDLLSERTTVKNEYRMARTSVRPEGNNPFKWAPPRRVAIDLLTSRDDGFLAGPAAVRESFEDLKKHLLCLLTAMRASLSATLRTLSPSAVEGRIKVRPFRLFSRSAASWSEYEKVFADFQQQADDNADSQINREFRAAYERQLRELDDLSARN